MAADTSPSLVTTPKASGEYEEDDVIDAEEVARLLKIGRKTVYEAAARKQIPHRRVLRRFLFSRRAIKSWLASRTGF